MQLNPARGRKLPLSTVIVILHYLHGLCSSTPRGDGNQLPVLAEKSKPGHWFMQLNPARGRKLNHLSFSSCLKVIAVYAAQPREGTETVAMLRDSGGYQTPWFMQLNPARGRKL